MKFSLKILALLLLCVSAAALAADTVTTSGDGGSDPVLVAARTAIAQQDWAGAQRGLQAALVANPQNADYHNLYAYSIRKGPKPNMELVFKHYGEAIKLNPKHRAAHEYAGEAYLMVNDLSKAKQHLDALKKLCFLPCAEYTDLKKSVAAYEAKPKS